MPDPIDLLLIPLLIAAGASLVVMLAFWKRPNWGAPIALAAGVIAPFHRIAGAFPSIPPLDSKGWLIYMTILAGFVALVLAVTTSPNWVQLVLVVLLVALGNGLVLRNRLFDADTSTAAMMWTGGMIVAAIVWWIAFSVNEPNQRLTINFALILLAALGTVRLLISSSVLYGRMGLALTGAVTTLAVIGVVRPTFGVKSALPVFVLFLTNLLLAGIFDADLGHLDVVLVIGAPMGMVLVNRLLGQKKMGWRKLFISLSILSLPLTIAILLRLPAFLRSLQVDTSVYSY